MSENGPVAIVGGGCAGLALAARLADRGPLPRRVVVLEPRTRYTDDRRWCFWRPAGGPFDRLVSAEWPSWRVSADGAETVRGDPDRPYQMVRSIDFYRDARARIAASPDVELATGVEVVAVRETPDGPRVETSQGPLAAATVVDTRPPRGGWRTAAPMLQLFSGAEIETETPRFDPATAGLMAFRSPDRGDVRFTYVLPMAANRALVEATRFAVAPRAPEILEQDLAEAIAQRVPDGGFRILQTEGGAIPMTARLGAPRPRTPEATGRIVRAGLAGGAARPSTGYAFLRIARWAECAAERIARDAAPPQPGPDRPLDRLMDAIFLSTAAGEPERAAGFFLSMFEKVPPGRLLRFLSDEARLDDRLAVAAALPPLPFLKRVAVDTGWAAARRLPAHRGAARRSPETTRETDTG